MKLRRGQNIDPTERERDEIVNEEDWLIVSLIERVAVIAKRHQIMFSNGERGVIHELDDGSFACPVCGYGAPIAFRRVEGVSESWDIGDVCDCCFIERGVDEGCASDAPAGANARLYRIWRTRWLDRVAWRDEALSQLRSNLEITEEHARRDADEIPVEIRDRSR